MIIQKTFVSVIIEHRFSFCNTKYNNYSKQTDFDKILILKSFLISDYERQKNSSCM